MPENVVVDPLTGMLSIPLSSETVREAVKGLFLPAEPVEGGALRSIFHLTGMGGPGIAQSESPARVNGGEEHLQHPVVEHPPDQPESRLIAAQPVSVSKTEAATREFRHIGLTDHLDSQLALEVGVGPDIVVAWEEPHRHPAVRQCGQCTQGPGMPPRNDIAVLIPEIEDIPQQEDPGRIVQTPRWTSEIK